MMHEGHTDTEPKLIGLFGFLGEGNLGNDGSLEAMLQFLRRVAPQEEFLCLSGAPEAAERAFGIKAIHRYGGPRSSRGGRAVLFARKALGKAVLCFYAMRQLRRLKVLIVPGMGILDDQGVSPASIPYDLFVWFLLARLMGVKVILVSVGAGPIDNPLNRWLLKSAARAAHYRSYRDESSRSFMASIGLDVSRDPVFRDIAFSLPTPPNTASSEPPLSVGIGMMTYYSSRWLGTLKGSTVRGREVYDPYIEKMTTYVEWLLARDYRVRIFIGEKSDIRAVQDLFRALRTRNPDRLDESVDFACAHTLHDVMRQMADTDVVVATRYHNVICALKMGKPTISIGYQEKNDVLLAEMGLAEFCQHIERLDVELLKTQTMRLLSDRAAFEHKICEVREHFKSKLREQESLLTPLIRGPSP
jgi:polysaccharide pyruvyl transferase WcaK-like protein